MYSQLKEEMDKLSADRASIDLRRKEAEGQLQSREVKIRSLDNENNALRKRIEEMENNEGKRKEAVQRAELELVAREEQLKHIRGEL